MKETPDLITTPEAFGRLVEELRSAPVVAADAEMDSFYSYREKICLVQFSTERGDYLLDPLGGLDLSPLGPIFADPEKVVVFHAAENDIPYFRRQYGFEFSNLFDTYLAARVLGYPQCGLAPLLEKHFQVQLDKKYQMADWRVRPLPRDMAEYARMDTRFLLPLREILITELEEADRMVEARAEFQRVARVSAPEKVFDPDGWVRMKGVRRLPPRANGAVRALYVWREEEAARRDVPVFRIMPDNVLIGLAVNPPATVEELREAVRHPSVRQAAQRVFAALRQGLQEKAVPAPRRPRRDFVEFTPAQEKLYKDLREWRNGRATERGVEPDRISPNRLLKRIVLEAPRTQEELAAVPGMEDWRLAQYGAEILERLGEAGQAAG